MTKNITLILALCLAATASAECDFPYYPEYADVFSQYDEVTPLMAKKVAMASPIFNFSFDEIVCEPLLLKDIKGMPYCYMVATYAGEDEAVARKWNNIIKDINSGLPVKADTLAEGLRFFYDNEDVYRDFSCLVIATYTFDGPVPCADDGYFPGLAGYGAAYRAAAKSYAGADFYFTRIIASGPNIVQIYEFEDKAGRRKTIKTDEFRVAHPVDLEELARVMEGYVHGIYERAKEHPEIINGKLVVWDKLLNRVSDDEAEVEFPRVL